MANRPTIPAEMLSDTMDVYTVGEGGAYTNKAKSGEPCRLAIVRPGTATGAPERAELAQLRRLYWGPGYTMPAYAQVEVDGQRWNVVPETVAGPTWLDGTVINWQCDVVRAE